MKTIYTLFSIVIKKVYHMNTLGGRPFYVIQDAALISSTSCAMNAIEFEVPLPRYVS